ncbi:unnamed protein product [Ilex paraguariensis]|uniref:Uncharacterized protein n=1 Tax=Ilex paraguariensis TaxID=185542 RepID=A0ABC8QXY9_9AQUA
MELDEEEIAIPPPMVANTNENDTITSDVNCSVAQLEDEEIVAIPLMVANTNENDTRTPDVNCSVTKKNASTDRDSSEKSYIDVVIVNSGDEGNDDYDDDELRSSLKKLTEAGKKKI